MTAALLPCPFCGGEAERIDIEEEGDNFGGSCIGCKQCGASSPVHFDRKENLVSSWNARYAAEQAGGALALRRIINHWHEFGPDSGFDEVIYWAERGLAADLATMIAATIKEVYRIEAKATDQGERVTLQNVRGCLQQALDYAEKVKP